jgi:hypothetical protein
MKAADKRGEERHKPNRPDGENFSFRGKRIMVAQGLQEPEQNNM